jgi:hypothetical protein
VLRDPNVINSERSTLASANRLSLVEMAMIINITYQKNETVGQLSDLRRYQIQAQNIRTRWSKMTVSFNRSCCGNGFRGRSMSRR